MFEESFQGITGPKGFLATGVHCGVKKAKKDLALVFSTVPAIGAAVFTQNKVPAAPIIVDKLQLKKSFRTRAIVINSGNANACTGERGLNDAWSMAKTTARSLGISDSEVLVSSTGVIGQYLPIEKIKSGIAEAAPTLSVEGHTDAAEAILTTDTFTKELSVQVALDGAVVTIGGMAKGSGMIAPNMATLLAFVTTDVCITPELLSYSLRQGVDRSFNRISVDGDMSTNDMVAIMANGLACNKELSGIDDPSYKMFYDALVYLLVRLCKMVVVDGEGATKFVEIQVTGAASEGDAVRAARAIANSSLVKTAIHGEDANWGRILAAVGYSGIEVNPENVEIFFGNVPILRQNYRIDFSEDDAKRVLSQKEITITVDLHEGPGSASFWTCDLSKEYVAINANYRS